MKQCSILSFSNTQTQNVQKTGTNAVAYRYAIELDACRYFTVGLATSFRVQAITRVSIVHHKDRSKSVSDRKKIVEQSPRRGCLSVCGQAGFIEWSFGGTETWQVDSASFLVPGAHLQRPTLSTLTSTVRRSLRPPRRRQSSLPSHARLTAAPAVHRRALTRSSRAQAVPPASPST